MNKTRLAVLASKEASQKALRREQIQRECETFWQTGAREVCALEMLRFSRTLTLLKSISDVRGLRVADLGCGSGRFARLLRSEGAQVTGVDASESALELFRQTDSKDITLIHDCLPRTRLEDSAFDAVVCLDLIAHLRENEYRLCVSEWARLLRREGVLVCSTPLDIHSNALERFAALIQTEFDLEDGSFSFHRLTGYFGAQSEWMIRFLESCSRLLYGDHGMTHAIFVGRRRPLCYSPGRSAAEAWVRLA